MATSTPRRRLADLGELPFLGSVRKWFAADGAAFAIPIGDDAAAIDFARGPVVATVDALIENVHFNFEWITPAQLGHKSLAVNLSDLAAMGARPRAALLALGVPPETEMRRLEQFFMGLRAAGRRFGCPLAGGDMTRAPVWTVSITALGEPVAKRKGAAALARRAAAVPGQTLYVTGAIGESAAGLRSLQLGVAASGLVRRHHLPTPRLAEAAALAAALRDLAMIDVSDGLFNDAGRIAEAAGVGVVIRTGALPLSPRLRAFCAQAGLDPLEFAIYGGEEYELLFATAAPPERVEAILRQAGSRLRVTPIGAITHGRGVTLIDSAGKPLPAADRTFRHFGK